MTDAHGKLLLSTKANLLKSRAVIHLDRGGDLTLQDSGWRHSFTIRDGEGRDVIRTSDREAAPGTAHLDDAVLVEIPDVLRLAEVISVVHIWRLAKKAAIASSTAASSAVARGA